MKSSDVIRLPFELMDTLVVALGSKWSCQFIYGCKLLVFLQLMTEKEINPRLEWMNCLFLPFCTENFVSVFQKFYLFFIATPVLSTTSAPQPHKKGNPPCTKCWLWLTYLWYEIVSVTTIRMSMDIPYFHSLLKICMLILLVTIAF